VTSACAAGEALRHRSSRRGALEGEAGGGVGEGCAGAASARGEGARPDAQVKLVPLVGHRVHQVLLQHPRPLGHALHEPRGGGAVARDVGGGEGVHVDADLVEAPLRLEDPDPVLLGLLLVELHVVLAEAAVRQLQLRAHLAHRESARREAAERAALRDHIERIVPRARHARHVQPRERRLLPHLLRQAGDRVDDRSGRDLLWPEEGLDLLPRPRPEEGEADLLLGLAHAQLAQHRPHLALVTDASRTSPQASAEAARPAAPSRACRRGLRRGSSGGSPSRRAAAGPSGRCRR